MESCIIRGMKLSDINQVAKIEEACFAVPWTKAAFEKEIRSNLLAKYYVVLIDDKIVAYGGMWLIMEEAHVTNIAVDPLEQGKGFGRRLTEEMIEEAKAMGALKITLEVRKNNVVAQNLYKSLGFLPCGIRPGYYSDNGEDAIIMWKDL
ncbi:ribosomal protein S18-alanine N-acetyltransferase [Alkaliphilus serpentinus]|uniref:[Ribosomal protein bS18]-alanine N-acetyltransferase n=1 Tax=Alkaliphilus serpentinus TaxID=1482731 RepID=A0A833HQK6_9FIRM|nr:ribosomal protein S18-alanine N-acetyltransferase [Alkaliphilus serpentinus]KAB3532066.1 ribosomal-protein-alanine N-acetyltransferase [Alkaliphilus serpentinus]